jgi:hypothetical protein
MFNLDAFDSFREPRPARPGEQPCMAKALLAAAWVAACACVAGCDLQPNVLFVANEGPAHFLQLTDAQEECAAPGRVCFSTMLDETTRGCWMRDHDNVRASFPDDEQVVPVDAFKKTEFAEVLHASL